MKKTLTLLLCFLALASHSQKTKSELALNLKLGKTYYHSSTAKVTLNQKMKDLELNSYVTAKGKMSFKVLAITDSTFDLEARYLSISMVQRIQDKLTSVNTDDKDTSDAMTRIMKKMINRPFNVIMLKTGKVKSIKNIDALYSKVFDGFPQLSEQQKADALERIKQAYGEKAFINSIEQITNIFPLKQVAVADKWKITTYLESGGFKFNVETTYSLAKLTGDYAIISGNATVKTVDNDTYTMSKGLPIKFDLSGTVKSTIKVHASTGWIDESNTTMELTGNGEVKDNPKTPGGLTIPMVMTTETKVEGK